jgi:hypothetical protein
MKKNDLVRLKAAKLQASFRSVSFVILLFLSGFGFYGCSQHGCTDPGPAENCNVFATVEEDGCWNTYLGNKLLRLDNGKLLLPQSSQINIPDLMNGQRVKLAFIPVKSDPQFSNSCVYVQAPEEPTPVTITCLEAGYDKCGTPVSACNTYATAENVVCGSGVWANTWLKLDDGTFLQPWETKVQGINLEPGHRYKLGYSVRARDNRYDGQVTCLAMPPAADAITITCMEEVTPKIPDGQ